MKVLPCSPSPHRLLLLPDWLPKPWWKRQNVRMRLCLALQLHFLCLFLCWSVCGWQANATFAGTVSAVNDGSAQQHQILQSANGTDEEQQQQGLLKSDWQNCTKLDKCVQQLDQTQKDIFLCYLSPLGKSGMPEMAAKVSRRFQLSEHEISSNSELKEMCSDCIESGNCISNTQQQGATGQWHGVMLNWKMRENVSIKASIFDNTIVVPLNVDILLFIKNLFVLGGCNNGTDANMGKDSGGPTDITSMADGAFLGDLPQQLEALRLDLASSLELMVKRQNQTLWWKSTPVDKEEVNRTLEETLKECLKNTPGDPDCELTSSGNLGISDDNNATDDGEVYGGNGDGTVLVDIDPNFNEDDEWTSVTTVRYNSKATNGPLTSNRHKRDNHDGDDNTVHYQGEDCKHSRFDLREKWPKCKQIIGFVRKQGGCGNCWAISTAAALTDRVCIATHKARVKNASDTKPWKFDHQRSASVRDTQECVYDKPSICQKKKNYKYAGQPAEAWQYYYNEGTVIDKCKPLIKCKEFDAFQFQCPPGSESWEKAERKGWEEQCFTSCDKELADGDSLDLLKWNNAGGYSLSYHKKRSPGEWRRVKDLVGTLYKVSDYFQLKGQDPMWEQVMMKEIRTNGTIVIVFDYYGSMTYYQHRMKYNPEQGKSQIYRKYNDENGYNSAHAIRLIGYGKYDCSNSGTHKYWLFVDSFGTDMHDNGIGLFARGVDECRIESRSVSWGNVFFPFDGDNDNNIPTADGEASNTKQ